MRWIVLASMAVSPITAWADAQDGLSDQEACLLEALMNAGNDVTVSQLKEQCDPQVLAEEGEISDVEAQIIENKGVITERLIHESRSQFDPYVITPHKQNYILPAYTTNRINTSPYTELDGYQDNLENVEAKFQLSLKIPLLEEHLFIEGDALYFGFTLSALWQVYSDNISKPFRETNYQPELFYVAPLGWHPFGGNTGFLVGFEHQSNGRSQPLSRSWNRVYSGILFEKGNYASALRPWVRISEDDKAFDNDPDGDDNPDIDEFMGHFEWLQLYKWQDYEFSLLSRYNFATHNGAAEFGVTFPLWGKLKGYGTFFSGYGDSLIDYNYKQNRFGIGVALSSF